MRESVKYFEDRGKMGVIMELEGTPVPITHSYEYTDRTLLPHRYHRKRLLVIGMTQWRAVHQRDKVTVYIKKWRGDLAERAFNKWHKFHIKVIYQEPRHLSFATLGPLPPRPPFISFSHLLAHHRRPSPHDR